MKAGISLHTLGDQPQYPPDRNLALRLQTCQGAVLGLSKDMATSFIHKRRNRACAAQTVLAGTANSTMRKAPQAP